MIRRATSTVVGVMGFVLLAGCASTEEYLELRKPTAQLLGVEFRDATLYGATVVFNVDIINHYSFDLPLLSFNYGLSSGGQRFLGGFSELSMTVPPGGRRTVSLPARVDYAKALSALGNISPGARIPYNAELSLVVNTPRLGSITLPLTKIGEVTLPAVSEAQPQQSPGAAATR
jgi:LEA14-like dessication related protein